MSQENKDTVNAGANQEFLVFSLGAEEYAVDILKVQEIRSYDNVTPIPNAPTFIKGVTNLRGNIVPIIDLRLKFNLAQAEYGVHTVVIVVNVANRIVGMVVDGVSDVMTLTGEQMSPSPDMVTSLSSNFITGLGTVGQRMLVIIDIEKLLSVEEMAHLAVQG
ncbi:chemotaxis protein CheW [Pseudomonas aeruginosa]